MTEAFPIAIGDMPVNWGDTNNLLKIPVTFTFYTMYDEFQWLASGLYDRLTIPTEDQIKNSDGIDIGGKGQPTGLGPLGPDNSFIYDDPSSKKQMIDKLPGKLDGKDPRYIVR